MNRLARHRQAALNRSPDFVGTGALALNQPNAETGMVYRFNADSLVALEKQFPGALVNAQTTDIQAGYLLGVQAVLSALRNGFTVA